MLRKIVIVFFVLNFIVVGCSPKPRSEKSNKIIVQEEYKPNLSDSVSKKINSPIIVTASRSSAYLLGGILSGKWVNYADADLAKKEVAKGGEVYKLYSFDRLVGQVKGEPAKQNEALAWVEVDFKPELNTDEELLGISGEWNVLPRVPRIKKTELIETEKVIEDILVKNGLGSLPAKVVKVIKIDLDGDGVEETIIEANNLQNKDLARFNGKCYSVVILQKLRNGKAENVILKSGFYKTEDNLIYKYEVPFIIDANGDGIMEIFVKGTYYEGNGIEVFDITKKVPKPVLSNGIYV